MKKAFEKFDRYELKYYIRATDFPGIARYLSAFMTPDSFCAELEGGYYNVNSLYFETHNFHCYRQKFDGLHERRKFRVRFYEDNASDVFFEVKKRRDCFTLKDRIKLSLGGYRFEEIVERPDVLAQALGSDVLEDSEFFYFLHKLHLRPLLWVGYKRTAFVGKVNKDIRLTFDKELGGISYHGRRLGHGDLINPGPHSLYPKIIMEIKFRRSMPYWLEMFIKEMNINHTSISKHSLIFEKCIGNI